jgi:hypothetical protein
MLFKVFFLLHEQAWQCLRLKKGGSMSHGFCYRMRFKAVAFLCTWTYFLLLKMIGQAMFKFWVSWWIEFYLMRFGFRGLSFFIFPFLFSSYFVLAELFSSYDFWNICDDLLSLFVITMMLMFWSNKNVSLCVAYSQYPNMFWTFFYIKKQIFEVSKLCFRMDFLNTIKNYFSCISGFYNMFVNLQRVLANIPKNTKILFWRDFIYYSPLMFG